MLRYQELPLKNCIKIETNRCLWWLHSIVKEFYENTKVYLSQGTKLNGSFDLWTK